MRISYWSSDVCSSDLERRFPKAQEWEATNYPYLPSRRAAVVPAITLYSFFGYKKRQTPPEQHCTSLDLRQCLELMVRWRDGDCRSEEHTSELQSLMRHSYDVY